MDLMDMIMAYEVGTLEADKTLELFAELIKTGQAWQLQGSIYGRPARRLIDEGYISDKGKILKSLE
jgi:hypothetical protein